jgi:hypothetical protein
MSNYIYHGDKFTDNELKGAECSAVRREDGKCIRGKNSNMLVEFNGIKHVVLARRLRKSTHP